MYDPSHPSGVPTLGPDDSSMLPISDLEYSPTPYCPPKLLFPAARKHDHARLHKSKPQPQTGSSHASESASGDEPEKKPAPAFIAGPSTPKRPSMPTKDNGKGKSRSRSRSAPKSEWDTSDEEDDEPEPSHRGQKYRHEVAGVKPRFPVDALPVHEEVADGEGEKEVERQIQEIPKKDLKRIAKIAPLLLDMSTEER